MTAASMAGCDSSSLAPYSRRIAFVHIPKTAGVSVFDALQGWAGEEASMRFVFGGAEDIAEYLALPSLDRFRLIAGHIGYPVLSKRDLSGWDLVTVVRNPIDRFTSTYNYIRTTLSHPAYGQMHRMSPIAFLRQLKPHELNQQCQMIGGTPSAADAIHSIERHFSLVGMTDQLGPFVELLSARLQVSLHVGHHNKTRDPVPIDGHTRRLISAANSEDQLLYEYVRDRVVVNPRWVKG